jgi:hypothetical protein
LVVFAARKESSTDLVHYDNSAVRTRIKKIRRKKLRNSQGGRVEGPEYQIRTAGMAMIRAMRNQEIMKITNGCILIGR